MAVVCFHCPFVGLSGCQDGGGNGLTKTLLITYLCDRHCNGDAQAIIRQSLSTNLFIFNEAKGSDFMSPLDFGDGVVRFVLYDLTKPHVLSSLKHLDHVDDLVQVQHEEALDKVICTPDDISYWSFPGGSLQLMRETLAESSSPLSDVHEEYIDLGERNINQSVVLDRIKSFPCGTSCRRDGLRTQHLMDCLSEAVVAISDNTPLIPLVKPGYGIRPILVGTVWRHLVSKAITQGVNRLIEDCGDDVGLSMLLVDFKNAFNLVDRELDYTTGNTPYSHAKGCSRAWYQDDGTIIGDTLVLKKALELVMDYGPSCGLHLNVDKIEVFWPKKDSRSRLVGIFLPNISRPLHGVKLLGGLASSDFNFSSEHVMKRVTKTIVLMDTVARINNPQCELMLLRACAGISKLYFAKRTCSPRVFDMAQHSFDAALCYALKRIVTASGLGFGDWQWGLSTLPFAFGGLASIMQLLELPLMMPCVGTNYEWGYLWRSCCILCRYYWYQALANVVCDTMVEICFWSRISTRKEIDIRLGGGCDKPLRHADMLLYPWDEVLDVCVDLKGFSPLTQTRMVDFVPGRVVIDATHRKRVKYEAKCANIGYGFLSFSFSSLGELENDAVTLLKRVRKFSVTQDIGARVVVHIFNRIIFAITKKGGSAFISAPH
ncbi:hypothetical protein Tco_0133898 [Tanacetum coccineum]